MNRITPTEYAEAGYQAKLDAKFSKAMKKGPAGVLIPPSRLPYRKTVDGPLLAQISRVAYASWRKLVLTPERLAAVSASLRADALRRFPAEDMAVLERYKLAHPQDRAIVELIVSDYEPVEHVALAEPMLAPAAVLFHVDLGGRGGTTAPPVPADTVDYFRDVLRTRREAERSFKPASHWVGVFRVQTGRFPYWSEIERQFPLIGEWMEGQRNG